MSASRSVAAARARRAGGNDTSRNVLRSTQLQTQSKKPISQEAQDPYNKKLSVSDAFALVTIRLGRVETILQKLDIANIADKMVEGDDMVGKDSANAVLVKSILSRVEDVEKSMQSISVKHDDIIIDELRNTIEKNEKEIQELKSTIFKMQSLVLDINQKLIPTLVTSSVETREQENIVASVDDKEDVKEDNTSENTQHDKGVDIETESNNLELEQEQQSGDSTVVEEVQSNEDNTSLEVQEEKVDE